MLAAHLVPGYFAAVYTQSNSKTDLSPIQRVVLWVTALGSTVAPDFDVVFNALFRGFFNHSTLWTHSIFVYLGFGLLWLVLHIARRLPYLKLLVGLAAIGGLSHLVLDVIGHGTPLLYPASMMIFGIAPARVVEGGVWAYLTDPIFLFEPLFLSIAVVHWVQHQQIAAQFKKCILVVVISSLIVFTVAFLLFLPTLQSSVVPLLPLQDRESYEIRRIICHHQV